MNHHWNTQTRCKATSFLPWSLPEAGRALPSKAGARAWPFHPFSYSHSGISVENITCVKSSLLPATWLWADREGWSPCRGNGEKEAETVFPEHLCAVGVPEFAWLTSLTMLQAQRKPATDPNCKPSHHNQISFQYFHYSTLLPKKKKRWKPPTLSVLCGQMLVIFVAGPGELTWEVSTCSSLNILLFFGPLFTILFLASLGGRF